MQSSDDLVLAFDDSKADGIAEKSPMLESETVEIREFLWVPLLGIRHG